MVFSMYSAFTIGGAIIGGWFTFKGARRLLQPTLDFDDFDAIFDDDEEEEDEDEEEVNFMDVDNEEEEEEEDEEEKEPEKKPAPKRKK